MNQLRLACRRVACFAGIVVMMCVALATNALAQDISVAKDGPATIVADTDIEYNVTILNFSGGNSTPPHTLTDTFPAELTFISAVTPDGWTCTAGPVAGPNSITCTSSNAIPNESAIGFSFLFHVAPSVSEGTLVTNTASIDDPLGEDNVAMFTSVVGTPPPPPLQAGEVLISEFRLSGPGGSSDEYIEFYCNRDANCDISGFSIRSFDPTLNGDFFATFPPNSIIPARQFALLATNLPQYTLAGYGFPDFIVSDIDRPDFFRDNEGIQLVDDEGLPIDSVGFTGGGNEGNYVEGTGLQRSGGIMPARPPDQYAYVRKRGTETNGRSQDTNNNANDFVLVSVTGDLHPGIFTPPVLGAPGPKGLTSPLTYNNSQVTASLVEPGNDTHAAPNRVRVGSGDSGTLSIRRSFTNNTGQPQDFIRFRVIVITTLNSPNTLGDPQADLRLVTSFTSESPAPFENSQGRTVIIRGSILEWDPNCGCEPFQPNGGGLNSTVFLDDESVIADGETIDVQFLLNVVKAGAFRFYIYVEAFEAIQQNTAPSFQKSTNGRPRGVGEPRKLVDLRFLPRQIAPPGKKPKTGTSVLLKSDTSEIAPLTMIPVRSFIIVRRPEANAKRQKRKVRVRRKAAETLREKIKAKGESKNPTVLASGGLAAGR